MHYHSAPLARQSANRTPGTRHWHARHASDTPRWHASHANSIYARQRQCTIKLFNILILYNYSYYYSWLQNPQDELRDEL